MIGEDTSTKINEIHIYYDDVRDQLRKHQIQKMEIYRYQDLVEYIKKTHEVPYEFELISDGKLLYPFSDLFASGKPLNVVVAYKYIRNIKENKEDEVNEEEKGSKRKKAKKEKESLDIFFKMRGIMLSNDILKECRFQQCLEEAKVAFDIDTKTLRDFKNDIYHTFQKNEASKNSLVKRVLEFAVKSHPFLLVTNEYYISDKKHLVKADHTVSNTLSDRRIVITADKEVQDDLFEGIIQNFDQLKTYSLTPEGSQYPFVYGITSNFNEWRICCYYVPEPGNADSKINFCVSKNFPLMGYFLELHNIKQVFEDFDEKFKQLVGLIRGLLRCDIDRIVAKKLGLKVDLKKIDDFIENQIKIEEENINQYKDNLLLIMDEDILTSHIEGQKKLKTETQ